MRHRIPCTFCSLPSRVRQAGRGSEEAGPADLTSFIKLLVFIIGGLCIAAGVAYGIVKGDVEQGTQVAKNLLTVVGSVAAVLAGGQYIDDETPESYSWAFDSVFKCFVQED